jgi:dihydropteroate synthase
MHIFMRAKDTVFAKKVKTIQVGDIMMDFNTPKVMGVLNLTPDSFYDGGKYHQEKERAMQVEKMLKEGASIIDLGAVSTRPGATSISLEDELERMIWPLERLVKTFPRAIFSVDTYRSKVAEECIQGGAHIINDISGGNFDEQMFETVAKLGVPYVLMHIHQKPETMQKQPIANNILKIITDFFKEKVSRLQKLGVNDIILDPGFGFGKTLKCNYAILNHLDELHIGDLPLLGGISRKSMINKVINARPSEAMNGTTVLNTIALLNGANILRVHDVKEAVEAIEIVKYYGEFSECS